MNFYRPKRTFTCDAPTGRPSSDPTGTMDIRRKYSEQFATRFRKVRNLLKTAVVAQDVLGLKPGTVSALAIAAKPGDRELHFKVWLRNLLDKVVGENDGDWLRPMLQLSYNRAIVRAMRLSKSNLQPHDTTDTINAMLALCKVEMHGIFDAVVQRATRAASLAWLHNESPAQAFVEMSTALLTVGAARARAMVELMVVKVFTTATLDQFEAKGVTHVGLIPETQPGKGQSGQRRKDSASVYATDYDKNFGFSGPGSRTTRTEAPSRSTMYRISGLEANFSGISEVNVETAGDDWVCQECQDIEDNNPYDIDAARSLIPAHPFCRCAFVPVDDNSDESDDTGDAATVLDYNENHDPKTGQFSSGEGGGAGGTLLNKGVTQGTIERRKAARLKRGSGGAAKPSEAKPSEGSHEPQPGGRVGTPEEMNKIIDDVCKQTGFNRDYVTLAEQKKFMLNGTERQSAASTSLFTLRVGVSPTCPIDQLAGVVAHETMHAKFENYLRAYFANKLPAEMQAFHKSIDFKELKKLDGISAYSRDYWSALDKPGSKMILKTAVHETLAEMARVAVTFGKTDLPGGVNSDWKKLYDNVNAFHEGIRNVKV